MVVEVEQVWKSYPARGSAVEVLRGVSLAVAPGEAVALTGESGSGKSTLLHLIGGLDAPDRGTVRIAGREIGQLAEGARARLRREVVGIVFQQYSLIPSLSVGQNIAFQARLAGRAPVAGLVELLGLSGLEGRFPEELSGGQQQRVAIGRALAARPALVLADEPTGNLDEATGDAVLALLLEGVREAGAALVMVTHSERLAARLDRRLHLRGGRLA